jgi:hypothetical protein
MPLVGNWYRICVLQHKPNISSMFINKNTRLYFRFSKTSEYLYSQAPAWAR